MNLAPYTRRVQYYETDQMGIAHHSNYIRWMEEARLNAIKQIGVDCAALEEEGVMIPVTRVDCRYQHALHFDEAFTVVLHVASYNGIRLCLTYEIFKNEDPHPAATGASEHCFIDKQTRRPINFARKFPELSARLQAQAE